MQLMSKKFSVTLPDAIYKDLEDIANREGRSTANLAAFLIECGIREIKKLEVKKQNRD
jgi:predicted DNA-binding protein